MAGSFTMPMMALGGATMMLESQRHNKVKSQNLDHFTQRKNALERQHAADVRQRVTPQGVTSQSLTTRIRSAMTCLLSW